jgi:hypothetical protein
LSAVRPHACVPVGVVVERRKATSHWLDMVWRPVAVLSGVPDAVPWTAITAEEDAATFYVGAAAIELYRTETDHYRSNLDSGAPSVWIALRPTGAEPPYALFAATADPAEGESFTQAGDDLVEAVPMPSAVREIVARRPADLQAQARLRRSGSAGAPPTDAEGSTRMNIPENFLTRWSRRKNAPCRLGRRREPARARPCRRRGGRTQHQRRACRTGILQSLHRPRAWGTFALRIILSA